MGARALTARQQEALMWAALGLNNRAIADRMFVEPRSVREMLRVAHRRLGLEVAPKGQARVEAAVWLWRAAEAAQPPLPMAAD
jgi:DNA-binding NarL/FixJ family response regulator